MTGRKEPILITSTIIAITTPQRIKINSIKSKANENNNNETNNKKEITNNKHYEKKQ